MLFLAVIINRETLDVLCYALLGEWERWSDCRKR